MRTRASVVSVEPAPGGRRGRGIAGRWAMDAKPREGGEGGGDGASVDDDEV